MKISVDISEAADQLEELIDMAVHQHEVMICRNGDPIAMLLPISERKISKLDGVLRLITAGRPASNGQTSNHDEMYDDMGLPK